MTKKYTSFLNCVSYACRMTPFFDTVAEVEEWERLHNETNADYYIRPVSNWQEVIDNRNSYNCDDVVPIGK